MKLPSGSILAQYLKRSGVAGHGIERELRSVRRGFRVPQSVVGAAGDKGNLYTWGYKQYFRVLAMSAMSVIVSQRGQCHLLMVMAMEGIMHERKNFRHWEWELGQCRSQVGGNQCHITIMLSWYADEVRMWVFEETLASGEKLTDVINKKNENVKNLPNVNLGWNVIADSSLENTDVSSVESQGNILQICMCKVNSNAKAISLIKGIKVKAEGPVMLSSLITEHLGVDWSILMGANIANEVAKEQFSEATVGFRSDTRTTRSWVQAFGTPYFHVAAVHDVEGVELCGTLKNVVAIAAGFVDGLGMGNNSKVAIIRIGINEISVKLPTRLLRSPRPARQSVVTFCLLVLFPLDRCTWQEALTVGKSSFEK